MDRIFKYSPLIIFAIVTLLFFKDTFLPPDEDQVQTNSFFNKADPKRTTPKQDLGKKVIYMVLWSGPTEIENGFKAYFKEHKIDAEYITRDCKGDSKACHELVKEIKTLKPHLIYTWGTPAALAIAGTIDKPNSNEYVWDIPIVSTIVGNPIFSKIIYELNKPGRNLTGVNHVPPFEAQLSTMRSYLDFKKVAIFHVPSEIPSLAHVDAFKKTCEKEKIEAIEFPYAHIVNDKMDTSKLDDAFKKIKDSGIEIVYLPPSNYLSINAKAICDAAHAQSLLTFAATELMLTNGPPLMGLISSYTNIGRFAAEKAEKILIDGMAPETLPYEKFEKFNFFIDRKVMQNLQIYPSISIIDEAHFIEEKKQEK
jgi:putative ABC transport system substrate-binding protein